MPEDLNISTLCISSLYIQRKVISISVHMCEMGIWSQDLGTTRQDRTRDNVMHHPVFISSKDGESCNMEQKNMLIFFVGQKLGIGFWDKAI